MYIRLCIRTYGIKHCAYREFDVNIDIEVLVASVRKQQQESEDHGTSITFI